MNTQDWRRLHELADRLEEAWSKTDDVDLGQFLPPSGDSLRLNVLLELITTDLEIRWRRHKGRPLEFYLNLYPELGTAAQLSPKLIYEEYRVRCRHGDQPKLELYQERFPEQFTHLQKLLQQDPIATQQTADATPAAPPQRNLIAKPMEQTHVLPIGGGYQLEKLIGRGGFGEVWRAVAPGGFPAAVKIIRRPADHEERLREERALNVIKLLNHHFLIKTRESWSEQDQLFIVMDLADSSLRERLKQCKAETGQGLPVDELLRYFREAAEALDYLHEQDVLHRDIKPDNILLVGQHVRLADFGLARHQEQILASVSGSGTPAYMAPEVWRGKASKCSDQYSLAYTYAELRLGQRAFSSTDYAGVMFDHLDHTPNLGALPDAEKQVLLTALAKKPEERFATCSAFVEALYEAHGKNPHASRPVPTIGGALKAKELPSTQVGVHATAHRALDANPVTYDAETFNSLLPHQQSELQSARAQLKTYRQEPPKKKKRSLLPFLIVAAAFVGVLGGSAALVLSSGKGTEIPNKPQPGTEVEPIAEQPWLPKHYKAAPGTPTLTDTRKQAYHQRLVSDWPGLPPVTFVLIPQESDRDPPSYYLMETKVSNALAAALAQQAGVAVALPNDAAKAELPAFGLSAEEADSLARVLKGRLPTTKQWDKATGLEATKRPSPYIGGPEAAVNRRQEGPRAVKESKDRSVFEILDLGGNGTELTRNLTAETEATRKLAADQLVPWKDAPPDALVVLRGQRHTALKPLSFTDLVEQQTQPQVQFYHAHSPFTGFRVVLEPPLR